MGVSRSRDDYRLGKPILHACYLSLSPLPSLWVLCSFHHFFFYLSFFSLSALLFFDASLSLSLSLSLCNPRAQHWGPIRAPFARRRSLLAFSTDEPSAFLPPRLRPLAGKEKFVGRWRKKKKERDCGQAKPATRTLSPKLDTIERTSIPSVITFVSLMLARPAGYLSLCSRAWIRSSIDLHPAGLLFRVSTWPGRISSSKLNIVIFFFFFFLFSFRYYNISFRFFRLGLRACKMADF